MKLRYSDVDYVFNRWALEGMVELAVVLKERKHQEFGRRTQE